MPQLDAKAYREEVLKPASKGEAFAQLRSVMAELSRDPRSASVAALNLHELFRIPDPVSEQELKDWYGAVVNALNKSTRAPASMLLKSLLETLQKVHGKDKLLQPSFWADLKAQRRTLLEKALETALVRFQEEYPLGVVTLADLKGRLTTEGVDGVTDKSIINAAAEAGMTVVDEFEVPAGGIPAGIRASWKQASAFPMFASLLNIILLHRPHEIDGVRIIDALATPSGPITVADLERSRARSEQAKDTDALQAAQSLLSALVKDCRDDRSLQTMVLGSLAERVTDEVQRGRFAKSIRDQLVQDGIHAEDAARLVAAVRSRAPAAGGGISLDQARAALAASNLAEARAILDTLPADQEPKEHASLLAQLANKQQRKDELLEDFGKASAAKEYLRAARLITECLALDRGDESLHSLLDELPPAPPRSVSAEVKGQAVEVSWLAEAQENLTYTVVRAQGMPPTTPSGGTAVATDVTGHTVTDTEAPAPASLGYAVFAVRAGGATSEPATAAVEFLPPPSGLKSLTKARSAVLRWQSVESATGAVVTRIDPDGRSEITEVPRHVQFQADGLATGQHYRFEVRSAYVDGTGRKLSEPAVCTVVPRSEAAPVPELAIRPAAEAGASATAVFIGAAGYTHELWSLPLGTDLRFGSTLTDEMLSNLGARRIELTMGSVPEEHHFESLFEVALMAALTKVDNGYLVGATTVSGVAPTITNVLAEAFGEGVRLSWDWPDGDCLVEISWEQDGRRRTRRVTTHRYRADGGAQLGNAQRISNVQLTTVMRVDDDEWSSPAVQVALPREAATPTVHYDIELKRSRLRGTAVCTITAQAPETVREMAVSVVLKSGTFMPSNALDGTVVDTPTFDFSQATQVTHEVSLGKVPVPFWVRMFATEPGIELIDPTNTSRLKMKG